MGALVRRLSFLPSMLGTGPEPASAVAVAGADVPGRGGTVLSHSRSPVFPNSSRTADSDGDATDMVGGTSDCDRP